jgi:hypothetical protein
VLIERLWHSLYLNAFEAGSEVADRPELVGTGGHLETSQITSIRSTDRTPRMWVAANVSATSKSTRIIYCFLHQRLHSPGSGPQSPNKFVFAHAREEAGHSWAERAVVMAMTADPLTAASVRVKST